jgi:hypothetical protein
MSIKEYFLPTRLVAIILIFIVGIFALNEYLYIHKHICKDGTVVIHAHPYNKSQDSGQKKSHEHSSGDLVFLASIQTFLPATDFIFSVQLVSSEIIYYDHKPANHIQIVSLNDQERAPPIHI